MKNKYTAIGLMSGTSADGIDAAIIHTDGKFHVKQYDSSIHLPYSEELRNRILQAMNGKGDILKLEKDITEQHALAVKMLIKKVNIKAEDIDIIGFHGQTISHRPHEKITQQIGNGSQLAFETGINVVCDFRRNDVAAGGEGAPLVPIYHQAIAKESKENIAFINIGGVSNITHIESNQDLLAFDCGPGNALIDDWIYKNTGKNYDQNGDIAASGKIHQNLIDEWLSNQYFERKPPKSLDRNEFNKITENNNLSFADGAATLTSFTAQAIAKSKLFFKKEPEYYYICGGGRKNNTLMKELSNHLSGKVIDIDTIGIDGDMIEAQAFAYLAVRRLLELPITFPKTTRSPKALVGGGVYLA